jgi:hypothetical protein
MFYFWEGEDVYEIKNFSLLDLCDRCLYGAQ